MIYPDIFLSPEIATQLRTNLGFLPTVKVDNVSSTRFLSDKLFTSVQV